MRTAVPLARDNTNIPWVQIWTLNFVGLVVGVGAVLHLTPLTFALAALPPLIAVGLRAWRPEAFVLGDSPFRPSRFNCPPLRLLSSIALFWTAPGFILAFRGLAATPMMGMAPVVLPWVLVTAALAVTVLASEWRLRSLNAASAVVVSCLFMALGYVLTANVAFDGSPSVTVKAVVTGLEVLGDRDRNGPSGQGTPTLHVSPLADRRIRWRMPVSRSAYARYEVGSQLCVQTRQGALGWPTGRIVECAS